MANDLNSVSIIGRMTQDAELKYNAKGTAIASLSLACNRNVKKGDNWETEVSYLDASLYGRTAEGLARYLHKGKMVAIMGHLKQDRWEKNGQRYSRIRIEVEELQLLGGNNSSGNSGAQFQSNAMPITTPPLVPEVEIQDFPEDIPF